MAIDTKTTMEHLADLDKEGKLGGKKKKIAKKMLARDFNAEGAAQVKKENHKGYKKYLDNKYK